MPNHPTDVIFEFVSQGRYIKVSAIDAQTGVEAVIVGDPQLPESKLKDVALRKLRYILQKQPHS